MTLPICNCVEDKIDPQRSIITPVFRTTPQKWQIEFVRDNCGKVMCWWCGGVVLGETDGDHVTATTTSERCRELGVI